MSHRSHQSSSEDVTSRNKRSDVLQKCKKMDGAIRRHAMEVFGKQPDRALNWYRKDLTCRIFMVRHYIFISLSRFYCPINLKTSAARHFEATQN